MGFLINPCKRGSGSKQTTRMTSAQKKKYVLAAHAGRDSILVDQPAKAWPFHLGTRREFIGSMVWMQTPRGGMRLREKQRLIQKSSSGKNIKRWGWADQRQDKKEGKRESIRRCPERSLKRPLEKHALGRAVVAGLAVLLRQF